MSSQGIMSGKKANDNPGLCPVKGQKASIMSGKKANDNPRLCPVKGQKASLWSCTVARNQFSSLSLSNTKTTPHYQMLVIHPACYLSFCVLPTEPPKDGSDPTNFWTEPSLASLLAISFLVPQHVQGTNTVPLRAG